MTMSSAIRNLFLGGSFLMLLFGCGTLPNGRGWGEDATLSPGLSRMRAAALQAIESPSTWIPVTGAAVFSLDHWDRHVSNWASERTPLFGSRDTAEKASNYLLDTSIAGAALTALATPSGSDPASKLKGLGVEGSAGAATAALTELLKIGVGRERPDGSNANSFPSGHSSGAFAAAAVAEENVESLPLSNVERISLRTGFVVLASGTAWARVEAKKHFPTDVLAGAALGNFVSLFIHNAFLGLDENAIDFSVLPGRNGGTFAIDVMF